MNDDSPVRYRMTKQKRVILEVLKDTKSHPTADWVYEKVRRKIPNISLGTVYRNLNILKSQGEILELSYGKGYSRYDGTPENHYHFTCESCAKVFDVDCPVAGELEDAVTATMGYKVRSHRLEFYGVCKDCDTEKDQ
jgi:Fur family ferric uptake transcriptional regulator/Fur family peroxide stress response transcriptional regulator